MSEDKINKYNSVILEKLSEYLNFRSDIITEDIINELIKTCNLTIEEAFSFILAEVCELDIENNPEDKKIYNIYFPHMIHHLRIKEYKNNPYYKNIRIPEVQFGRWKLRRQEYKPYEGFVYNDLVSKKDGRIIPQIGFFDCEFSYPAVLQDNREWMLITPNEIETMKEPINNAYGNVLTYGLGMGYYAYMVSEKEDVESITIVEKDKDVIKLFKKYILPQFEHAEKVKIINEDAYFYAENYMRKEKYDFVFTDLWHDPSDGIDMYLRMKKYEKFNPKSTYMYWIEDTMRCYIE